MSAHRGTETTFELTTIERLEQLGYEHRHGEEIVRPHDEVVFKDVLRANLVRRYPDLPAKAIDEAVARISRPTGVDTIRRNMAFHQMLVRGFELRVELPDAGQAAGLPAGRRPAPRLEHRHIYPVDWTNPQNNEFQVVNQLPVHGQNDRRPDIFIYVNGLPLVLFELKNPYAEDPTVDDAFTQVKHYGNEIAQVFDFNELVIVSDGVNSLHGMWPADMEWYAPWKSIDGIQMEPGTTGSMKTLIEGLFAPERLLAYLRDFIVFEVANDIITKKGAKYHQFFAVRVAADQTSAAMRTEKDKRIGVIWHATGSGKSLSMVFLVGMLRRQKGLHNPSFVIQVDRNDLDNQLYDQFVAARDLVGHVKHADSVDKLRDLLRTEAGDVIFTTIEKFRLRPDETKHPELSARSNIIIIADEAHRSQYGFEKGFARYLTDALPNARRLGFTGTPVSLSGADTVEVFGEVIHTYDIQQSQDDHATVPIYYAPRQVKLQLSPKDVDAALQEIADQHVVSDLDKRKGRWAALAKAAGAKDRVEEIAEDLLAHFLDRTATLKGKALVVCMTRENCVRVYDALQALPACPETKIVMTGNLGDDPPEWSAAGHFTTKQQRKLIKKRMLDPDDPLQIVIVCDMWLTGTDIPCLHTLYIDKPMRGHSIIQAISRVNRVFRDKPHGLIVDYIGIAQDLREATAKYTKGGGKGEPAPDVAAAARPVFQQCLQDIQQLLPAGQNFGDWRRISKIALEDLYSLVYGHLTERNLEADFLQAEMRLTKVFLLVKHLDDCRPLADEVIFYQRVRNQVLKLKPGKKELQKELERAVRDLVDDTVESEGVVDIFKLAGIPKADLSILDDKFLQTFRDRPHENLRLKLLEKLLHDEIQNRRRRNLAKANSFKELLEETLRKYHNRLIDAAAVIKVLVLIRRDMESEDQRAKELNIEPEELAFYDAVVEQHGNLYEPSFLRDLIHDVVLTIKKSLKVEWTEAHREDVRAGVRAAVKRVLLRRNVREEDFEPFLEKIMQQAEALYANWPFAA